MSHQFIDRRTHHQGILRDTLVLFLALMPTAFAHADDGTVLIRVKNELSAFAVSADGRWAALATADKSLRVFDASTGRESRTISTAAKSLAFSPDGKSLAIGGAGVALIDVKSGRKTAALALGLDGICTLAFQRDGKAMALAAPRGGARIWDLTSARQLAEFDLGHWGVTHVALSPDGTILVAAGNAMIQPPPPGLPVPTKFVAWNLESKKPIATGQWPDCGGPLLISSDGKTLAAGAEGGLDLWDLTTGKLRKSLRGHQGFPQAAAFSADGERIATGCEQGIIRLWDSTSGRARAFTRKTVGPIRGVAFIDSGRKLLSAEISNGETILRTWDATDDTSHYLFMPLPNECFALGVSADGSKLFAATDAGISRWNVKNGQELSPIKEQRFGLDGAAFSGDGKSVATLDRTAELRVWDSESSKIRLQRPKIGKFAAAFSSNGSLLAVADYNSAVILNSRDGKTRFTLSGHRKQITGIAFSPDDKTIVTVSQDQYVRWWDAINGKPLANEWHGSSLACVAISPDGKLAASGAEDGTVKVWDLHTREIIANLEGHEKTVRCLAFSPDSKSLATGSADGSCRIWDISEQKPRITIGKAGSPTGLAFMPDGKTLLAAGVSKIVQMWDPATGVEKLKP